ncbi:hypothetical protein BX666DRAFT_1823921, partial [Dichotomocladium elegans]
FPGTQPVSFETKHLSELEREDYFVCEKTDGIRYLLFFVHSSKGPASFLKTWRFLVFDLMALNGQPVTKRSFNTRLGVLRQEVIGPFDNSLRHITDTSKMPPFTVELKKMERSYGLHLVFDQMAKLKHSTDGVIWTPVKYPYVPGTCEKLLKWKPPELNTADFRIAVQWSKEHKPIYSLEVLSHGVTYKYFDHFQPSPELASEWKKHPPDGCIGEFRFVKFRKDKNTANDEHVVKKIQRSIRDGITKEQLLAHMDKVRSAWKAREKGH